MAAKANRTLRQVLEYSAASTRVLSAEYAGVLRGEPRGFARGLPRPSAFPEGGKQATGGAGGRERGAEMSFTEQFQSGFGYPLRRIKSVYKD